MQVTTRMRKQVAQMTEAQQQELMEQVPVFEERLIQLIKQGVADYRLLEITPCVWSLTEQKVVSSAVLPLNDEETMKLYVTPNVVNACTDYKFADPSETPPLPGTRIQFSDGIQDLRGTVIRYKGTDREHLQVRTDGGRIMDVFFGPDVITLPAIEKKEEV